MNKKDFILVYYIALLVSSVVISNFSIIYGEAIFYFTIFSLWVYILVTYLYMFIKEFKKREKWFFRIGIIVIMLVLSISTLNILKNYIKDYISDKRIVKLYSYTIKKETFNYYVSGLDNNLNKYSLKIMREDAIKVQNSKKEYIDIIYYKNTGIVKGVR